MNNFYKKKKKKIRKNIFITQKYRKKMIQLKNIHNKNDSCKIINFTIKIQQYIFLIRFSFYIFLIPEK